MLKQTDFIIIGQGLAGSILALNLIKRGCKVMVFDNAHQHSASKVAAGIINPITGHRLNLTAGFNEFFRAAERYYTQMQKQTGSQFWRPIRQERLIKNAGQLAYYHKRLQQTEYASFIHPHETQHAFHEGLQSAQIHNSVILDTQTFLDVCKSRLIEMNAYASQRVEHSAVRHPRHQF